MSSTAALTSKGGKAKKYVSRSAKAGLTFPVGRIARFFKAGKYAKRVGAGAPVYLTAVLEYLAAEVLEMAGGVAKSRNQKRITPTHIKEALGTDAEFDQLVGDVTIRNAAAIPHIHLKLLPKSTGKKAK